MEGHGRQKGNGMSFSDRQPGAVYEIQVQGELDQDWQQCFNGLTVMLTRGSEESPTTTLTGRIADQAALRGMLCRLWDLNLTLISVRSIQADSRGERQID
jgi:hypothetical protein